MPPHSSIAWRTGNDEVDFLVPGVSLVDDSDVVAVVTDVVDVVEVVRVVADVVVRVVDIVVDRCGQTGSVGHSLSISLHMAFKQTVQLHRHSFLH